MAITWTFGGTALSTYGKVILMNDYLDIPERRGDNIQIAFQHGDIFAQKYYAGRRLTFGITLNATSASNLEATVDALKTKLALMTQQTLAQTMEDTTVRNISASVDEFLEPDRIKGSIVKYVITFKTASPFYRLSTAIADNTTVISANPTAMVFSNPGTVAEFEPTIILTGPLSNTVITNSTNGFTLTYTGTIASPRVVTISKSAGQWVATTDLGVNVIGNITHTGGAEFMRVNQGSNTFSIADSTATTGTVKITFNAPFI